MCFTRHAYGSHTDQVGDLYLPPRAYAPVICLLHGGFWRLPYGREHIAPIAADLVTRGFAVWNLEYRRVGSFGGGWPGTLEDVARGLDHLATLAAHYDKLDLGRVYTVGHSAGGHLALWAAAAGKRGDGGDGTADTGVGGRARIVNGPTRVKVCAAVGLAPVADLVRAYELRCGKGAVADFLGGSPDRHSARYRTTSPLDLVPLGVKQLLIHGTHDEDVPVELSRRYARAATAAGDAVQFIEMPDAAHMDFVDPASVAHATLCRWLLTG